MPKFSLINKNIWVAGHNGMVGAAIVRQLQKYDCNILTVGKNQLDLTNKIDAEKWIKLNKPDYVVLAAAKVGGIKANNEKPVDFLKNNIEIQNTVISLCAENNVQRLIFLGSSCIYPKKADQPIKENQLLDGKLETTNQWYAIAKICGIKMCQAYRKQYHKSFVSVMPPNLYGPNDNFNLDTSHVLPALLRKIHLAKSNNEKQVVIWGSGKPKRELMYVGDLANAVVFVMQNYDEDDIVNIGSGKDISITDLARCIASIVDWQGDFRYDDKKPDGTMAKLMDNSRLSKMGWHPKVSLQQGIRKTYRWFLENQNLTLRS